MLDRLASIRGGRKGNSLTLALLVSAVGLCVYWFDNNLKDPIAEGSVLKTVLQSIELLTMGPGLGVLAWSLLENMRLRERHAQQRLDDERAQRFLLLGRIAASVAHEIRNPLHNLRLIGEALSRDSDTRQRTLVARLEDNLRRMDHSVALVYELARPNQQQDDLVLEPVVLESLLDEVIRGLLTQKALIVVKARFNATIAGREASLRIAFANLLRNACEAAGDQNVIIAVTQTPLTVRIVITNPGSFPHEVLSGESSIRSTKPQGMGVGMGIARHLLERMAGILELENHEGNAISTITLGLWRGGDDNDDDDDRQNHPGGR